MSLININIANVEKIQRMRDATIERVDDMETIENVETLNVIEPAVTNVLIVRIAPPEPRADVGKGIHHMSTLISINDTQKQRFTYDPSTAKDAAGNSVPLGPNTTVSIEGPDDPSVASIAVDGLNVVVSSEDAVDGDANGSVGQTQAVATISDPDSGVTIQDVIAITVVGSAPVAISGTLADPEPR